MMKEGEVVEAPLSDSEPGEEAADWTDWNANESGAGEMRRQICAILCAALQHCIF